MLAAAGIVSFAAYVGGHVVADRLPTGDEPNYLQLAHSLLLDGDLDLTNDVVSTERALASSANTFIDPHGGDARGDGRLRSQHPPAWGALLVPAVAVARALDVWPPTVARVEVAAIGAAGSVLLLVLALRLSRDRLGLAAVAWAPVALGVPYLPFATQLYPEIPAAVALLAGIVAVGRRPSVWTALAAGLSVSVLVALHLRYGILGIGIAAAWLTAAWRPARREALAFAVPVAVTAAAVAAVSWRLYGSPLPTAGYGLGANLEQGASPSMLWYEGVGSFLSASSGWFVVAPVAAVALPAAASSSLGRRLAPAWWIAVGMAAYAVVVGSSAWAGGSLPARLVVVVTPAATVGLVALLLRGGALAGAGAALAALTTVVGLASPFARYQLYDTPGGNDAPIATVLAPLFPTLIWDHLDALHGFVQIPGEAAATTGTAEKRGDAGVRTVVAGRDAAGFLAVGPYAALGHGRYVAHFPMAGNGPVCADLAVDGGRRVLASRCVPAAGPVTLEASVDRGDVVEARVSWDGSGAVALGTISLEPVEDLRPDRGWPWVGAWVGVMVAVATWLARRPDPYGRHP